MFKKVFCVFLLASVLSANARCLKRQRKCKLPKSSVCSCPVSFEIPYDITPCGQSILLEELAPLCNLPSLPPALLNVIDAPNCQCQSAPICKCQNTPVCQCQKVRVCQCKAGACQCEPICQCQNVRVCQCKAGACQCEPVCQCQNVRVCQCKAGACQCEPICQCQNVKVCQCKNGICQCEPVCQCQNIRVCQSQLEPICQCSPCTCKSRAPTIKYVEVPSPIISVPCLEPVIYEPCQSVVKLPNLQCGCQPGQCGCRLPELPLGLPIESPCLPIDFYDFNSRCGCQLPIELPSVLPCVLPSVLPCQLPIELPVCSCQPPSSCGCGKYLRQVVLQPPFL